MQATYEITNTRSLTGFSATDCALLVLLSNLFPHFPVLTLDINCRYRISLESPWYIDLERSEIGRITTHPDDLYAKDALDKWPNLRPLPKASVPLLL